LHKAKAVRDFLFLAFLRLLFVDTQADSCVYCSFLPEKYPFSGDRACWAWMFGAHDFFSTIVLGKKYHLVIDTLEGVRHEEET